MSLLSKLQLLAGTALMTSLCGCGLKGPLYLPEDKSEVQQPAEDEKESRADQSRIRDRAATPQP